MRPALPRRVPRGARRDLARVAAVVIVPLVFLVAGVVPFGPAGGGPPMGAPGGRGTTTAPERGPAVANVPDAGAAGPRTILADAPCNTSANEEVAEAFDPAVGSLYAAWVGCGGIGFARSLDAGYSFQGAIAVPGSTSGVVSDPSVAVAPNGTVYVGYIRDDVTGDAPLVAWSADHGASFASAVSAFAAPAGSLSARDTLAVAPNGTLVLTWIYSPDAAEDQQQCDPAGDCWFSHGDLNPVLATSSDGGAAWSAPQPLDASYPSGGFTSAALVVAPDGAIDVLLSGHVVSAGHALGAGSLTFLRSTSGGSSWSNATNVTARTFAAATPWVDGSLSLDPSGTLSAAFDAQNGSADNAYVAASTDNGTTWGAALRLNPDTDTSAHGLVSVAAAANGTAQVVWLANNSSGGWRLYGVATTGNATSAAAVELLSNATGLATQPTGATLGVAALGGGSYAVAWSMGVTYARLTFPQVLSTVTGTTPPVDSPTITSVVPGAGEVTLGWLPPTGPNDHSTGFVVIWGLLHQRTFYNLSYARSTTFSVVAGIPVDYAWYFEVAASNGAGAGPDSAPVNVTLTAWGVLRGTVAPANANVTVDGKTVAVANGTYLLNTTIGLHLLSAIASAHASVSQAITLPWNGTVYLNVSLALLPGAVSGYVAPPNATVLFDGQPIVVGPDGRFDVGNVSAGRHVVAAEAVGFVSLSRNVSVAAGATAWANLTLPRANGTVRLTVLPTTAVVRFNGSRVPLSAAGTANVTVPPGVYVLNVTAAGYYAQQQNVTVDPAMTQSIPIVLLKLPPPPPPPTPQGFPLFSGEVALVIAVAIVLAVAAGMYVVRRRRRIRPGDDRDDAIWEPDAPDGADEEAAEPTEGPGAPKGPE